MDRIYRNIALVILYVFFGNPGIAQNILIAPINVAKTTSPIKLDGKLDDEAWKQATTMNELMQAKPVPGSVANYQTEIKLLFDNENLYVGITAYDSVGKYIVSGLQRDKYYPSEDGISIMIDTYNDKIHSLLFYSNTVGARFDEEVIDNGDAFNSAYNTFWDVKTHVFNGGYAVEFAIPFSSLRFQTKEKVVMGFKVIRQIGRKNEVDIFPKCEGNLGNMVWRVNSEAELIFGNLSAKIPVYISPYIKANYTETNTLNNAGTGYVKTSDFMIRNNFVKNKTADRILSNVGIDAKIGVSKNFTLDATLNTDFAQAEADSRVFNYTRFNIFLPEKRQFFLEANDYMNFSLPGDFQLFNSRNIGIENGSIIPIVGGLRLTGKSKGWQLGALDIQTQGLQSANVNPENFGVFHLHKDLFKNGSYASGFFANRITTNKDSISNQTLGFDFLHRLNDKWTYGLNIAGTKDVNVKKLFDDNIIYNILTYRQVSFGYSNFFTYTKAGKNFNPASGFYTDKGFDMAYTYNGYTWQIKNKKKLNYFDLSSEIYFKWRNVSNTYLETNYYNIKPSIGFKNGMLLKNKVTVYNKDYLPAAWNFSEHITIPSKFHTMAGNEFTFESPKNIHVLYQVIITTDKFYGGNRIAFEPQINGGVNKHFSLQLYYLFTQINFPKEFSDNGNGKFQSHLFATKFIYSFTIQTSFNMLMQYDNVSKTVGANFRFRYNPIEGTDLYVVYNPNINTQLTRYTPKLPQIAQQVLIVKFTKTFSVKTGKKK